MHTVAEGLQRGLCSLLLFLWSGDLLNSERIRESVNHKTNLYIHGDSKASYVVAGGMERGLHAADHARSLGGEVSSLGTSRFFQDPDAGHQDRVFVHYSSAL